MATSGVIGTFAFDVDEIIAMAVRACGLAPSELTPDQALYASSSLELLLKSLPNDGFERWLQDSVLIGLIPNVVRYELPPGAVEVVNCMYRQASLPTGGVAISSPGGIAANAFDADLATVCTQSGPNGYIEYNYTTTNNSPALSYVGINTFGTHTYSLVWEYSLDGVTWQTSFASTPATVYTDNIWTYYQINNRVQALAYRVRETAGGTLSVRGLYFGANPSDITMGRMNRDDYQSMTQKSSTANDPISYYVQEEVNTLALYVWPQPNYAFDQLLIYYYRQPQDVGELINTLELPFRWHDAIIMTLAARLALYLPNISEDRITRLEQKASGLMNMVNQTDYDRSPVRVYYNNRSYQL